MSEEQIALACRAVACRGWRWMGGMLRVWPFIVRTPVIQGNVWSCFASNEEQARGYSERMPAERVEDHPFSLQPAQKWDDASEQWVHDIPDLTDPATLGCLLALVREAHGRRCYTQAVCGYWTVQNDDTEDAWGDHCIDEAEALVFALEAAPCGS